MLTLAENVIVAGADNCPPMLDKTRYSSWASCMLLYIKGKKNEELLIDLVLNKPFKYGTVIVPDTQTTPATIKDKTYDELIGTEKIHECSEIALQERDSKLYDEFNMFTSMPGETIHTYYLRQHEAHESKVRLTRKRYPNPIALVANISKSSPFNTNQSQYHQQLSLIAQQYYSPPGLVVPSFLSLDDPIASLIKAMAFISTTLASRYAPTNNQLRTSSNPRNQETIQDGSIKGTRCYNYQEEGHVARQCTKPKRPRNSTWFKEKAMLAEALELGVALYEEQVAFFADNGDTITLGQAS
uniref:CCHC-type domain-containing protein n=1 Tax=Tanacetum cinerariifolium TaxID=118510 RepID=A0A6L2K9X5_TANCI|nr:hypothetical protein [Tanacetum cinerariifolium]